MEDTIAAISTAYGEGGIGIVRISGEDSIKILEKIFVGNTGASLMPRRLSYGHIIDIFNDNKPIDEVLAVYMPGPKSYTCEDVVEINCHGSLVSLRKILALVLRCGARAAEKGEFTKRAFLNGRLDLSQAEAVIGLIRAKTDKAFEVAMDQLEGGLSNRIKEVRRRVLDMLVEMAVNIDYPDEDIEELTYSRLEEELSQIGHTIRKLLSTAGTGRIIREGLAVSIIGKPNVGKSSLMNALLRETRAIVTEIPGTTRDTIEEYISIRNIPVKLTDTAGIRETEDIIEKLGIEKSKKAFNTADLIIFVLDGSRELTDEDIEIAAIIGKRPSIVLLNKSDLGRALNVKQVRELLPYSKVMETAVTEGMGITEIEETIEQLVYGGKVAQSESMLVTDVRHIELLEKALSSTTDALKMTERKEALDFLEIDVKNIYENLGEIIGETVSDDIIDEIFSRFCLGK